MLQTLSNESLMERFAKLVRTERKITHLVIACINEIEIRKIYLDRAYSSLFEYLTKEFGYSESAAYRRIAAARLVRQVPEVARKIEDGSLNLSQASLLVQTVRSAERASATTFTSHQKLQIVEQIENKSFQQSQQIIHFELGVKIQEPEKTRANGDGSITLTLTLSPEQANRWRQVAELTSHALGSQNSAALIDYLAQKEISRRTEIKRASPMRRQPSVNPRAVAPNVRKSLIAQAIPSVIKNPIFGADSPQPENGRAHACDDLAVREPWAKPAGNQNSGCGFRDPVTQRRCGSKRFAQIDHRQPVWAEGPRDLDNLQILCAHHNRRKYQIEAGIVSRPDWQRPL